MSTSWQKYSLINRILVPVLVGTAFTSLASVSASEKLAATTAPKSAPPAKTSAIAAPTAGASEVAKNDPYLWLEDISGDKALNWAREQNAISTKILEGSPIFSPMRERLLKILDSKEKIPAVHKMGQFYYNFWRDDQNVRGLWRRTTLEEFKKEKPKWETVIDLDKLAADEKENWVWQGDRVLYPDYDRTLIELSRGGADASVIREFDLTKKEFVKDGFNLPEAKSSIAWRDRDSLYVGTDFGPGSMTTSGYPRIIKEWKRGTPLSTAHTIFEGKTTDVGVDGMVVHDHGLKYDFISEKPTFYTELVSLRRGDDLIAIDKPADAELGTFGTHILLRLRSDWTVGGKLYKAGTFLTEDFESYLKGERKFDVLFEPTERTSLDSNGATKSYMILSELDNVNSRSYLLSFKDGTWSRTKVDGPAFGTFSIWGIDPHESDDYFASASNFLTPSSLYYGVAGKSDRELLKSLPEFFKTAGLEIQQFDAKSKDGTRVPYFQVSAKGLKHDGNNPTLLYGYGGFESSVLPRYDSIRGAAWMERGGVYVVANIRGGGEFGPDWHNAARKEHRQRAYDDFIAVAEDLIARKVTSPMRLGIEGRSNGGLLMGVMLTERPDLFGAVHCGSPLLDMKRYNHLLAGASWMDEYGDPDKADEWAYISKYSPYQNVRKNKTYPPILITTSTKDDRVHPGHARKLAALLKEQGHDVLYYENIEGGHGASANNKQTAFMEALAYTFLWKELSK
jgi:prolyl oligopeptidase